MRITSRRNVTVITAVRDNNPCFERTYAQASGPLRSVCSGHESCLLTGSQTHRYAGPRMGFQ